MYWTHPSFKNLTMDVDKTNVFAYLAPGGSISWEGAYDNCRAEGVNWNLPSVASQAEVTAVQSDLATLQTIPLGMVKQANKQFGWITSEDVTYADWEVNWPQNTNAEPCASIQSNGKWKNVNCASTDYTNIICEARLHVLKYVVSYIADESEFVAQLSRDVFSAADLPNSTHATVPVFGATIQHKADQCRAGDRFTLSASNDKLSVSFDQECVLNVIGPANVVDYNAILNGVTYHGQLLRRTELRFAYIYWTNVYVRDMIYDMDTGHAYNAYFATASMSPRAVYATADPTSVMCTTHGMDVVEVTSLSESLEQMRTQRYGEMYLGGERVPTSSVFKWTASTVNFPYQMWRPLRPEPFATNKDCVKQSSQFDWEDVLCTETVPSIGCEAASWTLAGSADYAYPPTSWDPTKTRILDLNMMNISNVTEDANWFEDGPNIFGATVQMATYQCMDGKDTFILDTSDLAVTVNQEFLSASCILFLSTAAPQSVSFYKEVVSRVQFNSSSWDWDRIQVTFGVMFWTDSNIKRLMMDVDKGNVFGFVDPAGSVTWEAAYDACRAYGNAWNLPSVTSNVEVDTVKADLAAMSLVPLGIVRQATGQFGWVTSEDVTYGEWKENYPQAVTNKCAEIDSADGKWWWSG
jgi:hypothetical protein